jgi:glucosamine-6-phosphate deaminase
MKRYASLLNAAPIDLVCLGVGENGHIAFNDPPVADFDDPFLVKEVELDEVCRLQQVNDGAFASLEVVPVRAITLTVPAPTRGESLFCVVPGPRKAMAVKAMLTGPVAESCPASVLRRHPDCTLYLDAESALMWLETLT